MYLVMYGATSIKMFNSSIDKRDILYICKDNIPENVRDYVQLDDSNNLSEVYTAIIKAKAVYLYDLPSKIRNEVAKYCYQVHKPTYITTKLSDITIRSAKLTQDGDSPVFYIDRFGMTFFQGIIKRLFDLTVSCVALGLLSPLFVLIAILIKLEDGQEIFYRQVRCTKDMKEFEIIKFRSMVVGAEETLGVKFSGIKDSRLTKIGYFLRRSKLDELPQLINIIKGDMSIVGPRPERPELIENIVKDVPEFIFRNNVPAGLTGYAQVHGHYHTAFLDKLKWDLFYIQNQSFLLDIKIMMMTIPVVLRGGDDVK